MSNFWKTLEKPLINCDLKLILTWSEKCVLTGKVQGNKFIGTGNDENPQCCENNTLTGASF